MEVWERVRLGWCGLWHEEATLRGGLGDGAGVVKEAQRSTGLRLAAAQRLGGYQRPLGDAQAHVAVISDPVLGYGRPGWKRGLGICT